MASKTLVLITGANTGLGYYALQQMAATGKYHILMGSRDLAKAREAIDTLQNDTSYKLDISDIEPVQLDVTSDDSTHEAAAQVKAKYGYLDILMVNQGIAQQQKPDEHGQPSWRELYHQHYNTNLFGSVVVVEAFLPLLHASKAPAGVGKRIAFTSSDLSSCAIAREGEGPYNAANFPIYRSTKTALNMVMLHYARALDKDGFIVGASNPGYCATNLNAHSGLKDPRDGCKVLIKAVTAKKEDVHGYLINEDGPQPW
ncbi:Short-chain dehydrogenase/reductase eupG [Pseudocercospora fuligena]|uniref:Short-chain dehydrogenase/reductase eupG n=1 Tax=Pseudocercospora fuligena TaxID=685502 RepID=A0A8H6VRN3_9PEZI|nr:Short-chain dehydrogenase/reductase eupG [Pseudocercospora fuligena]